MIGMLSGRLVEKNPTDLLLDCNGVGYEVRISLNTYAKLGTEEAIRIYTKLIVREDAQLLYGFHETSEREMFNLLISVSGIGPNTAIIMLSSMTPEDIAYAIQSDNVAAIQKIKGIGAKTAQRVIIDLRGKVTKFQSETEINSNSHNTNRIDALNALLSLGFDKKSVDKVLDKLNTEDMSVEHLIKEALRML
jgi:Holliday junction DNA helicase RuvA